MDPWFGFVINFDIFAAFYITKLNTIWESNSLNLWVLESFSYSFSLGRDCICCWYRHCACVCCCLHFRWLPATKPMMWRSEVTAGFFFSLPGRLNHLPLSKNLHWSRLPFLPLARIWRASAGVEVPFRSSWPVHWYSSINFNWLHDLSLQFDGLSFRVLGGILKLSSI